MNIGIARKDITPPIGLDLSGFLAREGPSIGVHDPLYLTALVAEDAGQRIALVSCDLIGLGAAVVRRVRQRVAERTAILPEAQMYACTHTHSGPETGVITSLGYPDPVYLRNLEDSVVDVVQEAAERCQPARIGWGRAECHTAHNRVLARAGQDDTRIDPEVVLARITTPAGNPIGTILHYTCHPTAAGSENRLVSADWCGVARQQLEERGDGPVVIVNGAGGDINARMERRGFPAVEKAGGDVAAVADSLWADAIPREVEGIGAAQATIPLAMLPLAGSEEIATLWQEWDAAKREHPENSLAYRAAEIIYRDHARRLVRLRWGSDPVPCYQGETQAIRIGPLVVVSLPGEFFSAYGMRIKASSPAPATLIAGWSNDNLGYFPTAEAFPIGGYEMDTASRYYGFPAPWAPEAGAAVTERAIQLVKELF